MRKETKTTLRKQLSKVTALVLTTALLSTSASVNALAASVVEGGSSAKEMEVAEVRDLHLSYSFGTPEFEPGEYGYKVSLDGAFAFNAAGMPDLPAKTISFLIPQGKTVDTVKVTGGAVTTYENMLVSPALELLTITETTETTVSDNEVAEEETVTEEPADEAMEGAGVAFEEPEAEEAEEAVSEEALDNAETALPEAAVAGKELSSTIDFEKSDIYDHSVYTGKTAYPGVTSVEGTLQEVRGFHVYTITLYPMEYSGTTLKYTSEMNVDVTFKDDDTEAEYYPSEEDLEFINDSCEGMEYASTYFTQANLSKAAKTGTTLAGSGKIDYIIITNKKLSKSFQKLADYKASKGLRTAVVTTEKIYKKYKGKDKAEEIRLFIKDAYSKNKVTYVLLGGDGDNKTGSSQAIIPTRQLYCEPVQSGEKATEIASDVYYSCLTGNYNSNRNKKYGEKNDGEDGKDVDLAADVYVGRAPVDNKTEADNFVTKTINYETRQKSAQALMIGEQLSGNITCSAEIAAKLQDDMDAESLLDALRVLRDTKIKSEYTALYYDANDFVKEVYLNDLALLGKTASVLSEYMPMIAEYATSGTSSQVLAEEDILCLQQYVTDLSQAMAASEEEYANKQVLVDELTGFCEYLGTCTDRTFAQMFEGSNFYAGDQSFASADSFNKLDTIYGGTYKEEIRLGSDANDMSTKGFAGTAYTVETLYDKDSESGSWTVDELLAKLNASPELINHLGHANVDSLMRLNVEQIKALTNENAFFFYSQGCYDGSFDNRKDDNKYSKNDSIAEELVVASNKSGAFAAVVNSRYGWYNSDASSTKGPSQIYDRLFWDEALHGKNKSLGAVLAKSKEADVVKNYMNDASYGAVIRYCYYELNLLGDPETKLHDLKDPNLAQPSLTVKKSGGKNVLSWKAVKGVSTYYIYRSTSKNGTYKKIGSTKSKKYTDKSAKKGTKYFYKVAVYKKVGSSKYYRYSAPKQSK